MNYLVESLLDKPVKLLDLSDNAFGPDGIRPLVPLISKLTSLETLKLHNTGLGPQGGQLLAQALRQLAENCGEKESDEDKPSEGPLRRLVVGRSRLENGSMKDLADALAMHPNLEELVLPQNGIRPEGTMLCFTAINIILNRNNIFA